MYGDIFPFLSISYPIGRERGTVGLKEHDLKSSNIDGWSLLMAKVSEPVNRGERALANAHRCDGFTVSIAQQGRKVEEGEISISLSAFRPNDCRSGSLNRYQVPFPPFLR